MVEEGQVLTIAPSQPGSCSRSTLHFILMVGVALSACSPSSESPTGGDATPASEVVLEKVVHFSAPDGSAVVIDPAKYAVAASDSSLRLTRVGGRSSMVVAASVGSHDTMVSAPTALSFAQEDSDIHHIVLLLPGGRTLDASGTYIGVAPRGLRDRLAERPLIQKALQAKEALQARVHDGLFGAQPSGSLGTNAFPLLFNEQAVGRAVNNAYLLTYLATLIYPDFLDQLSGDPLQQDRAYVDRLHKNPQDFVDEYAARTHHLFGVRPV